MPHSITNYQRGWYLILCKSCGCSWRLHTEVVKLRRSKSTMQYTSNELEKCVSCGSPEILTSEIPLWKLWRKKNPVHQPYHIEVSSPWGVISSVRFHYANDTGACGSSIPYLAATCRDHPINIRGELVTPKNVIVNLDTHCTLIENNYEVNPFYVVACTKGIVLYRLDTVRIVDTQPFVSMNTPHRAATLTSTISFSACVTYADPILTQG